MSTHDPERALTSALRAVAEDDASFRTSREVEARLLQEVTAIARARRAAAMKAYAFAAVLVLTVLGSVWSLREPPGRSRPPNPEARIPATERTTEFFPLFYSNVPATDVQLVRLVVSRGALVSFGLESGEPPLNDASATVLADVVVGADGLARAIRFVWPPSDVRREEQRQ
jgi:hypothetical protein